MVCTVLGLISILGRGREAIGSQGLRYGLRDSVITLPAHLLSGRGVAGLMFFLRSVCLLLFVPAAELAEISPYSDQPWSAGCSI